MEEALGKKAQQKVTPVIVPLQSAHPASGAVAPAVGDDGIFAPEAMSRSLARIRHYCRELLGKYQEGLSTECREYVLKIQQAAEVPGGNNLNQIKPKERSDAGRPSSPMTPTQLQTESVDLGDISKIIVDGLMLSNPQRRVKFISGVSIVANGNQRLLRIALRNLLHHAWKSTSDEEQTEIELGILEFDGEPAFFVSDNGTGFDIHEMESLLNSEYGSDEIDVNQYGLDTVAKIIRTHGGRIWARGKAGGGSAFYFTIGNI